MNIRLRFLFVILLLFLDQLCKYLAKFFHLVIYQNPGIAFGVGSSVMFSKIVSIMSVLVLSGVAFLVFTTNSKSKANIIALIFIVAGGMSNLIDRMFNHGMVLDFIKLGDFPFPVFNPADIFLTMGISLFIYNISHGK